MNKYEKYKFLKEELKAPRFENEDEEIEWFAVQLYGLYNQALRLRQENNSLIYRLNYLFELLRKFLRKLLQRGNDYTKDETAKIVQECYDEKEFDMSDVVGISRGTTKQDELFDYVEAPDYLKSRIKDYDSYEKNKNDFEISL